MGNLPNHVAMVALLAALGIAPFAALMVTSYTKLVVVFGLLRSALGIQQVPPNIVLNGIALILSVYIMAPVGMDIGDNLKQQNFSLGAGRRTLGNLSRCVAPIIPATGARAA